jgi:hypothetical protein
MMSDDDAGAQPAERRAQAPSLVAARRDLAPGEWALVASAGEPPGPGAVRADLRSLAAGDWPPSSLMVIRRAALPLRLGVAVLHYCHGGTVVYCRPCDITADAADGLALLAARAATLPGPPPAGRGRPRSVSVLLAPCRDGHGPAHLAAAVAGGEATFVICDRLITARLAAALTVLGTEQLRCLDAPPGSLAAAPPRTR